MKRLRRNGPLLPGLDVHEVADEVAIDPVIPKRIDLRAGLPLRHPALPPVPGAGSREWRTPLKRDFARKNIAARRVKLQLVVVTEPVESRTLGDLANGRGAGESGQESPAGK